jgi:putative transposase
MSKYKKQSHVIYKCDYHIVWVPKYRFRILTGEVSNLVDKDIRVLSEWLACEIIELNVRADHVHVVVSIHRKYLCQHIWEQLKGR